ncbi:metal-sensitive transcriptional regulator [Chromobacterium sp. IIBBL 290-4]|uniref:metal-sensitive transcriptional regulator n=1 Tax=Chromobacterium sp. IIBBL 290-4 TaxID=2953890 RepID=UPI0020B89891|nr:metal-sensitive transcriptional regulator [Chromobacterium sp. IIBBL 290-4]UTH72453.1 metal-sensitive transcriptional regulator [Chromobacterium sp. IIBBL 290-4]
MSENRDSTQECCHEPLPAERTVVQPGKAALLKRLARIEGQVRGISGMIESDRYCVDVLTQVAAVKSAMDAVALQLLENHMKGCVARAMQQGDATGMVTELIDVVKKVR